jgi:outer membrane receptor for ferrienterochelin and colicins
MLLLAISGLGRRASAQSDTESSSPVTSEVVVTGTRTPEQAQRAAVKTDVVSREEAERRGATNVAEALSTQPAVQVNPGAYGYLGTVSPIQIQGFDLGRVLILEDGEPVIGDVGGAIDLAAIPISDLRRIEIVTGPSSALYGSSAIGGVVNLISVAPSAEGPSARARSEYRSHRGVVLQGSAAYRSKRSWTKLALSHTRQAAIAEVPGLPDTQIPQTARSLLGVHAGTQLNRNIDVSLRARWLHQRFDGVESSEYPGLGRYVTDLPQTSDRYALHFLENVRLSRWLGLRLSLARQWVDMSSGNFRRDSPIGEQHLSTQTLHSFEATATAADGPRTWVLGARFESQRLTQELQSRARAMGDLVTRTTSELMPQGLNSAAGYAQLAWKFGPRVTALPGARAEYHGHRGSVVAPRLALAWRPNDAWTLRVSGGRGFRTPSAEELGFNFDHSIYGYRVTGNPALEAERSWGINADVSLAAAFGSLRAGGFANWVDNLIDIDLASGMRAGTVVSYTYKNFQRVRTAGANLGLSFQSGTRFRADLAYDYLWTRDVLSEQPLSGRPAHTITASARSTLWWQLELYLRARVVSDAYVDRSTRSPGYETVDARVSRWLWPALQAYAGVLNLFDVKQNPGQVGDLRPPLGRVVYAGLALALPGEDKP